jgi:hypothetical protein
MDPFQSLAKSADESKVVKGKREREFLFLPIFWSTFGSRVP